MWVVDSDEAICSERQACTGDRSTGRPRAQSTRESFRIKLQEQIAPLNVALCADAIAQAQQSDRNNAARAEELGKGLAVVHKDQTSGWMAQIKANSEQMEAMRRSEATLRQHNDELYEKSQAAADARFKRLCAASERQIELIVAMHGDVSVVGDDVNQGRRENRAGFADLGVRLDTQPAAVADEIMRRMRPEFQRLQCSAPAAV